MPRITAILTVWLLAAASLCATGCQAAGARFLSFIGLEKKPLALALVLENQPAEAVQALNPFGPYSRLQRALSEHLGRPVSVDACFPFQVATGLDSGWYSLAIVTPVQYAQLPKTEALRVLAVPADGEGRAARGALLVVAAGTEVRSAAELSGQVVAFGPRENARTHLAAMQLLREAGLQRTDLALELLPVPGSLKHMPDGRAVAQTVINGSSVAGFIDEAAWETLAEHTSRADEPARDQMHVIGRTAALPDRLWVASPKLDDATLKRIQGFLLALGPDDPDTLRPLNASGFRAPSGATLAACRRLVAAKPARAVADQPPASGDE